MAVTDAFAAELQAMVEATRQAIVDPADQIRMMLQLAYFTTPDVSPGSTSAAGIATNVNAAAAAALARRAALTALANACADFQPRSADDANAVLAQVIPAFDHEIDHAAAVGDTATYAALRATRTAVATDLQRRGALVPELTVTYGGQPARVIAYRLYGDATREDEIVARNNATPFPGCMPPTINVLSK